MLLWKTKLSDESFCGGVVMINIPIEQIKERISKKTGISDGEISAKIKDKLKQLSGLISEEGAAHIVANELGVKLFEVGENLQIKNILSGMRNVDLNAKVVQRYETREFTSAKGPGRVASMLVGDETGLIRAVLWNKQVDSASELKEGDTVKIVGGYVRENQGRKEVHLNDMSRLIINPTGVKIDVKQQAPQEFTRKKISEIIETDASVEIFATIVQVFDLNFFEVCPQCRKRVRLREEGFVCQSHGKVEPDYNYVLNIYVDDSSDNIRVVLWREQVQELLAMSQQQILAYKEDPAKFEQVKHDLLGKMIIVSGKASKNQTFDRIELVASKINKNPNAQEEMRKIDAELAKPAQPPENKTPPPSYMKSRPSLDKAHPDPDEKKGDDEFNIEQELVDIEDI
jgi:ssDNA-binding replication factor A large subunit